MFCFLNMKSLSEAFALTPSPFYKCVPQINCSCIALSPAAPQSSILQQLGSDPLVPVFDKSWKRLRASFISVPIGKVCSSAGSPLNFPFLRDYRLVSEVWFQIKIPAPSHTSFSTSCFTANNQELIFPDSFLLLSNTNINTQHLRKQREKVITIILPRKNNFPSQIHSLLSHPLYQLSGIMLVLLQTGRKRYRYLLCAGICS